MSEVLNNLPPCIPPLLLPPLPWDATMATSMATTRVQMNNFMLSKGFKCWSEKSREQVMFRGKDLISFIHHRFITQKQSSCQTMLRNVYQAVWRLYFKLRIELKTEWANQILRRSRGLRTLTVATALNILSNWENMLNSSEYTVIKMQLSCIAKCFKQYYLSLIDEANVLV